MKDTRPIGMFDSGVGGLTVYKEIKKELPTEKIIYVGDTKGFPYGSKSKEEIIDLSKKCIDFLIKKNVKMIIIACGTATSNALKEMQEMYDIPIIGIIEPTVQYVKEKELKNIGVIATRGTIRSNAWENNLKAKLENINVYNRECPLLASMAEEGWTENEIAYLTVKEYLKDFKDIDSLILGCTHYPLYENIIKEILPNIEIINTGKTVAEYMKQNFKVNSEKDVEQIEDEFYLTDIESNFINVANNILKEKIEIRKL